MDDAGLQTIRDFSVAGASSEERDCFTDAHRCVKRRSIVSRHANAVRKK